ncbi:MAG: undecaprenyl/decaprenyl-phosphate alpha-N-acetylglucosaminyl 1-phosphate transferase, partial [Chloroflexi bacterium]|nr:undecaprenyl/decaprenyl-phosphate alpha-N-acetylglucosaminyl 1-phosphate transferase [Chloroflexota bacterium]
AAALIAANALPPDARLVPFAGVPELAAIFAATTVILAVGMTDDRRGEMTPLTKLIFQFAATTILIIFGIRLSIFGHRWIDLPLTYLWVLGLTNALNLLDNMDGLTAGAAAIASTFFFLLAVLNSQILVALLAAALVGACLGFLVYNYNPASIFMGDSGSLSLGFLLAVLSMKLQIHNSQNLSFLIAALVLSVPIFDTGFVTWRRLSEGRRITQGGKDHTSHRLLKLGLNQKQAVWSLYGASFLAGMAALIISQGSRITVLFIIVPFAAVVVIAALLLSRVKTTPSTVSTA